MIKPLWLELYEGFLDDIECLIKEINLVEDWVKKDIHNDRLHKIDMEILKNLKIKLKLSRREFKKIYGKYPNFRREEKI